MWRELIGFLGAAIAVVNGVLAIIIAILPVRLSVVKLRLAALGLAMAVTAIVVTLGNSYYADRQQQRELSERRDIREQLEGFIGDGRKLLAQISDPQQEMPNRAADEWAQSAEIYLRAKRGDVAVARFHKDVDELYGDAAVPPARLAYWRAVRNRVVALEGMAAELPNPLRPSPVSIPKL